jgi:hypothetical protein
VGTGERRAGATGLFYMIAQSFGSKNRSVMQYRACNAAYALHERHNDSAIILNLKR